MHYCDAWYAMIQWRVKRREQKGERVCMYMHVCVCVCVCVNMHATLAVSLKLFVLYSELFLWCFHTVYCVLKTCTFKKFCMADTKFFGLIYELLTRKKFNNPLCGSMLCYTMLYTCMYFIISQFYMYVTLWPRKP